MNTRKSLFLMLLPLILITQSLTSITPKITIIIVVDQLSYQTFERLSPHFKYGFKKLLENGINFTNANHQHGNPVTSTGHATISTGAYANNHGIVLNSWMDENGASVNFGEENAKTAAVFSKNGVYNYGMSAHHLLVETLSDKIILASNPQQNFSVYAIANKPGPAIALAGKFGKAIWLDDESKRYTSSKAYFEKLPAWLENFNQQKNLSTLLYAKWKLAYNKTSSAYQLSFIRDYRFSASYNHQGSHQFPYEQTPLANQILVQLCQTCIDTVNLKDQNNHIVLWVSISNLDILGHLYGQNSIETTDILYHLDRQLDNLITYAQKKVGKNQTLVTLTADHGCCPIPELLKTNGFYAARRLDASKLKNTANKIIEKKYKIKNIIIKIENTQFFLNKKIMATKKPAIQKSILMLLQNFIEQQPGIKKCWTKNELEHQTFDCYNLEQYYKNQFHAQRSGDLILMPFPYTYITTYPKGTGHTSAYAYDTQVPLIIYQKGTLEKKLVNQTVSITQLVPTLANMLNVSCPSGAIDEPLNLEPTT